MTHGLSRDRVTSFLFVSTNRFRDPYNNSLCTLENPGKVAFGDFFPSAGFSLSGLYNPNPNFLM